MCGKGVGCTPLFSSLSKTSKGEGLLAIALIIFTIESAYCESKTKQAATSKWKLVGEKT
ncbi:hypothetical protein M272_16145 [Vibrio natriegens NBRC 15636 = ATCC 14048 = DSM 759]|nr:hypothetical protein M272_16145 [Vibrio natriegens NBRC 15636 = ATCC 14048 = DSM 759]